MEFLNSLKKRSKHFDSPFSHWELNEPLSRGAIDEICKTEIADLTQMNINYDGTRAIDDGEGAFRKGISSGGKAIKFRCFIGKNNYRFKKFFKLFKEMGITRELGEKVENWKYNKIHEANRIANIIKNMVKN